MADLVYRLRNPIGQNGSDFNATYWLGITKEAADRIETLETALRLYAGFESNGIKWEPIDDKGGVARAALVGEKKDV